MSEMTPLLSSETDRLVLDGTANSYLAQARLSRNQGPRLEKYDRFGKAQWSRQVAAQQEVHAFGLSVDMFGSNTLITVSPLEAKKVIWMWSWLGMTQRSRTLGAYSQFSSG